MNDSNGTREIYIHTHTYEYSINYNILYTKQSYANKLENID